MNYYLLGEQTTSIFGNMFSCAEKFVASMFAGLATLFAPVYVPVLTLTALIIVNSIYGYKACKKYNSGIRSGLKYAKSIVSKLRDAIIAICGAYSIEKFVITSISLHSVEFIAGAMALVEFWELIKHISLLHPEWKVWSLFSKVVKKKSEEILKVELDDVLTDDKQDN